MSTYRTATGKYLDINALKIQQERTIAVGNARQNARGDLLGSGGNIVKTRDEIMKEYYQQQKGNQLTDNPVYANAEQAQQAAMADILNNAQQISDGFDQIKESTDLSEPISPQTPSSSSGGYADALTRSQELADKIRSQRSKI